MRAHLLVLCGLVLGGCAWEPGQGFTVVDPSVRIVYEALANRATTEGYQRLSSDYQLRVDSASMRLSGIELIAVSQGSGAGSSFDPANPPAGYSLCHNGHCHRSDGALIPYAQVAAEMGGGGGSTTVVTLSAAQPANLLVPEVQPMTCAPSCSLPQTEVTQGRWTFQSLKITGTVRDSRVPARFPGERTFELSIQPSLDIEKELPEMLLTSTMELPSDRTEPPDAKLRLGLTLTAALFDRMDWSGLKYDADGVLRFTDMRDEGELVALIARLNQLTPTAEVTRGDP